MWTEDCEIMNYREVKERLYSLYGIPYKMAIKINCNKVYRQRIFLNKLNMKNPVEGEDMFVKKWRQLDKSVTPFYYRFFSHYIHPDTNIVPEYVSHIFIEPILNPLQYRDFYEDKNVYDKLFPTEYLPQTVFRSIRGCVYDKDYNRLYLTDQLLWRLCCVFERIVVKPTVNSSSGKNVFLFERNKDSFVSLTDGKVTLTIEWLNVNYGGDFIVQECIRQSDFLSQFNPTSVNTLRIHAYRSVKTNEILITNRVLRIGKMGSVIDNAHAGGILLGIKNSQFNNWGCDQWGKRIDKFNGVNFIDNTYVVPSMEKVDSLVKSVVSKIYHHRSIALDIALGANERPYLIEFNLSGFGSWAFQLNTGPAYGEYADEIIDYCRRYRSMNNRIIGNNYTPLL